MQEVFEGEKWRPVEGFYYEVSNLGRVRSTKSIYGLEPGSYVKNYTKGRAYPEVFLQKRDYRGFYLRRQFKLHILVAAAFLGRCPPGHEVNHKDLNKKNPRADNLEYLTSSENKFHAVANGAWAIGERRWNSTLTEELVNRIWALYREGLKPAQIAFQLNLTTSGVSHVVRGRNWKHLRPGDWESLQIPQGRRRYPKCNSEDLVELETEKAAE